MAALLDAAKNWYRSEKWGFETGEGKPLLRLRYEGKNGAWPCFAHAMEKEKIFIFFSLCFEDVPSSRIPAVLEYIARVNAELPVGNFELEFESRAVRFRTSVDVQGGELSAHLIKSVSLANVVTTDRFLPGLQAVVHGGDPAKSLPPKP